MNLASWLLYIESLHPREIDMGLDRVARVAASLQLDFGTVPVVTVAGTNGKGSCVALLDGLLQTEGLKVGAYTSPHLQRYNERIRLNGAEVSDTQLCQAFEAVEAARGNESLTYFEFGTLAAFYLFKSGKAEILLLEVGLGGRLDAVNIIDATIAVITSIDLDHVGWLGSTREAIGREKAGIVRHGRPLVCVDPDPPVSVLDTARYEAVPVYQINREFGRQPNRDGSWDWWGTDAGGETVSLSHLPPVPLNPDLAAAALQVLLLLGQPLQAERVGDTLAQVRLAGRFELRRDKARGRRLLLDVAHNPAAAGRLSENLARFREEQEKPIKIIAVLAIMADKDVAGFVAALASQVDIWYISQVAQRRCLAAGELARQVKDTTSSEAVFMNPDLRHAYRAACEHARPEDLVVITGSFFTVGAIQEYLQE